MNADQVLSVVRDVLAHEEPVLPVVEMRLPEFQAEVVRLQGEGCHLRARASSASFDVEDVGGCRILRLPREDAKLLERSHHARMCVLGLVDEWRPFRQEVFVSGRLLPAVADAFSLVERHDFLVGQVLFAPGVEALLREDPQFIPVEGGIWGATAEEAELPPGVLVVAVADDADDQDRCGRFALVRRPGE
jgi:hypothetical protein